MAKKPFIKIGSLLMAAVLSVSMLSVAGFPALKTKAEDAQPTVFTADFSSLPNGAVDDADAATVAYLKERFSFYFYQHLTEWKLDSGPLMYFFERSGVNGYLVDTGDSWRFPDTAGVLHHTIDGQPSTDGHGEVNNTYYVWDQIPTWTVEDGWLYCTAYSGDHATPFRQSNLMYIRGNTENTLANIKNFDLQMDFMFHQTNDDTIKEGKDAFAVIFDAAVAGNVGSDKQLMFAVSPDGKYFLGKPTERYTTELNGQFTDAGGSNVMLERGKKYHLSMRHIGNNVTITISDADGNALVQHQATVPTVLSGVGGDLAIGGSNAGAKYANITLTRLDDDAKAYDFDDRTGGYQFGVTAREVGNWVSPYWSDWNLAQNALYLRNDAWTNYWSNKWPDSYNERVYYEANGESMFDFNSGAALKAYATKMGEKFNVYHDAVNGGTHYFAQAPEFNSHHVQSGIDGSWFGIMYLSANNARSMALTAYLDKGKNPEALLDQTMSLVPKMTSGEEMQTKNFRTQFTVRLPASSRSAIALSFRSDKAGASIGDVGHGYAGKTTLLLSGSGYYLDDGSGDLVQNGAPSAWNAWNDTSFTEGDATVYAEAIGTALKLRVIAASGTVLLEDTLTIPDGDSGYLYYSALDTHGYFYSVFCDRLDETGKIAGWDQVDGVALSELADEGKLKVLGHADFLNDALQMDWTSSGFEITGTLSGDVHMIATRTDHPGMVNDIDGSYVNVIVDGGDPIRVKVPAGNRKVALVSGLAEGKHTVQVTSATSAAFGSLSVSHVGFTGTLDAPKSDNGKLHILAIGDSITAGFGVYGKNGDPSGFADQIESNDGYWSYAAVAGRELDARLCVVAKESGRTSEMHEYVNELTFYNGAPAWDWSGDAHDVVVINLGTNDEANGTAKETVLNDAKSLLDDMRAKNPDAEIIWVYGMMRKDYEDVYRAAVQYMNDKGDSKVHILEMTPDTTALEGHPSKAAHAEYGKQLADYIRGLVGEPYAAHTDTLKTLNDAGKLVTSGRNRWSGTSLASTLGAAGFTIKGAMADDVVLHVKQADNMVKLAVIVDGSMQTVEVQPGESSVTLAAGLSRGTHTIEVRRATSDTGMTELQSIEYCGTLTQPEKKTLQIEFLGDSITVGDGMLWAGNYDYVKDQNTMLGYASKTAAKLNADFSMVAHSGITTAGMLTSQQQSYTTANETLPLNSNGKQIVVINLGTNDIGLPASCDTAALKTAIGQLLDAVIAQNDEHICVVWAYGMMATKGLDVIRDAVESQANGRNIWFCDLSAAKDNAGAGEHPSQVGNDKAADILAKFIQDNCLPAIEAGHKLVKTEAKAATCQAEGNTEYYTCSICGKIFSDAAGTTEIDQKDTVTPKAAHKLDKTEKKDATHFADGNIEYYTCSVCRKLFSDADGKNEITQAQTVIDKIAHTYGDYQHDENGHWKECSCGDRTAEGAHTGGTATCNKRAVCTVCGVEYGAVDKTKHGETEVRDAKKATCTTNGYTGDTYCKACGDKLATGTVIPAAHDLKKVEAKAASCTAEGNIEYYRCSVCSKLFSDANGTQEITEADTVVAKAAHDLNKIEAKAASCTAEGNIEYYRCSVCGKLFGDAAGVQEITAADTVIAKTAHKLNKVEAKAATAESEGNIEHYTCADCGKLFADAEGKKELSAADVVIAKLSGEDKPNPSDPGSNGDKSPTTGEHFYPIALAAAAALAAVAALIAALVKKKKGAANA